MDWSPLCVFPFPYGSQRRKIGLKWLNSLRTIPTNANNYRFWLFWFWWLSSLVAYYKAQHSSRYFPHDTHVTFAHHRPRAKILVQIQLDLSDALGTTGNVRAVQCDTVHAADRGCPRKRPDLETSIFASPALLKFTIESIFIECAFSW